MRDVITTNELPPDTDPLQGHADVPAQARGRSSVVTRPSHVWVLDADLPASARDAARELLSDPRAEHFMRGGARLTHDYRYRVTGTLIHAGLGVAAQSGAWTASELQRIAGDLLAGLPLTLNNRRALSVAITTQLSVYRRFFWSPLLAYVGAEVVLRGDSRCDVLWQRPDLGVLVDEVKTGMAPRVGWVPDSQMRRYLDVCRQRLGARFIGLRVCWLRAPGVSATLGPDGRRVCTGPGYPVEGPTTDEEQAP